MLQAVTPGVKTSEDVLVWPAIGCKASTIIPKGYRYTDRDGKENKKAPPIREGAGLGVIYSYLKSGAIIA